MGKTNFTQKEQTQEAKPARSKDYIAVDVFRTHFGKVSERAIREIYGRKTGITGDKLKRADFSVMVNYLRRLENPDYIAPTDQSIKKVEVPEDAE